jgi:Svf1-like N-terminal lipocalin domain/Svf1-like C-terminal lipocalin-like domain
MYLVYDCYTRVWYPTVQFTCKIYNPTTKEQTWRSLTVSNFVSPPAGQDKRSCKADQFSITYRSTGSDPVIAEGYAITVNLSADFQLGLTVSRPSETPGFKIGKGKKGGFSYFGADPNNADGYVVHRFWPRTTAEGHIIRNGAAQAIKASSGMFVHAIQGMRPNLVARRWNFGWFSTPERGGVSAIQMEFKTLETHGKKGSGSGGTVINVGSIVIGGKLVSVTAETRWKEEEDIVAGDTQSRIVHYDTVLDPDTKYNAPSKLGFYWTAPSIVPGSEGRVKAELEIETGSGHTPEGLIEKVDILGEIPWAVKQIVHATGTRPYMYQVSDLAA